MLYILTKWILYHILYPWSKMDIISYQYPEKSRDLYHILFWWENLNKYDRELHNTYMYIIHGHDPHDIKPPLERKLGLLLSPKPQPFTPRCHFFWGCVCGGGGSTHLKWKNMTPFKKFFSPLIFLCYLVTPPPNCIFDPPLPGLFFRIFPPVVRQNWYGY